MGQKRVIYMYLLPFKTPALKVFEDSDDIYLDSDILNTKERREKALGFYKHLGSTFDEKYEKIKEHNNELNLTSHLFWSNPEVKFTTE